MNIHQILAGFAEGDAISHEAAQLRDIFRRWGHSSELFADTDHVAPNLRAACRPLGEYVGRPGDICLHHYGLASPAAELFFASPARKILVYHNITPAEYFVGFDDAVAAQLRLARAALPELGRKTDAIWAVSQFDAEDLRAAGLRAVKVFPLLYTPPPASLKPEEQILARFAGCLKTILFVGRIAPNKRIEDLIQAFAWYHQALNPYSRLLIVGSPRSAPRYFTMLRLLAGDLDLPNVCFEGFASPAGLAAYYRVADLYVSTSEHEGYCLPLVEAMDHDVPIIARSVGGTPEAMGGGGILYEDLKAEELGALMHQVLTDSALREAVLRAQRERIRKLRERPVEAELKALLAGWLK